MAEQQKLSSFHVFRNSDSEQWSEPIQMYGPRTLNGIRYYLDSLGQMWNQTRRATVDEVENSKRRKVSRTVYECHSCSAIDCKLWRPCSVHNLQLICWRCLESKGYEIGYGQPRGSDQVYDSNVGNDCWVPAVPDLNGNWWGYTSVPKWWVNWWKSLPNKQSDCTLCLGTGKLSEWDCPECLGSGVRK